MNFNQTDALVLEFISYLDELMQERSHHLPYMTHIADSRLMHSS